MMWFRKKPPVNPELLRKAAALLRRVEGKPTLYEVRLNLRAELISQGYDVEAVNRALAKLLEY